MWGYKEASLEWLIEYARVFEDSYLRTPKLKSHYYHWSHVFSVLYVPYLTDF